MVVASWVGRCDRYVWCWCLERAVHVCVVGILGRGDVADVCRVVIWCGRVFLERGMTGVCDVGILGWWYMRVCVLLVF